MKDKTQYLNHLFHLWLPLAASRLMMHMEFILVAAVISRLPNPTMSLAAFGGIVYPTMFLLESPVWMLLSASTALCTTKRRYHAMLRFGYLLIALLTLIELTIIFTPLYTTLVEGLLGASKELADYSRIGFILAIPWAWFTADRRLCQGILIRFGDSRSVGIGTTIRLTTLVLSILLGEILQRGSGIAVGTGALTLSLFFEFAYIRFRFFQMNCFAQREETEDEPLSLSGIFHYYLPLALTSLTGMLRGPISSAAMFRMPLALASVAVYPVARSLVLLFHSLGMAYVEVVIARIENPNYGKALRTFTLLLGFSCSIVVLIIALSPLAHYWFSLVMGLPPDLLRMAELGVLLMVPTPLLTALQGLYPGRILVSNNTRSIVEAMVLAVIALLIVLGLGVYFQCAPGAYIALAGSTISVAVQTIWLRRAAHQQEK